MSKKNKWLKKDLDEFTKLIASKKYDAEGELEESRKRADEMMNSGERNAIYSSHMADASGDHVELEKIYYMIARTRKYISYLDKANKMIKDGTFGICVSCEELIPKARLEEVPHTTKCVDCKENRNY